MQTGATTILNENTLAGTGKPQDGKNSSTQDRFRVKGSQRTFAVLKRPFVLCQFSGHVRELLTVLAGSGWRCLHCFHWPRFTLALESISHCQAAIGIARSNTGKAFTRMVSSAATLIHFSGKLFYHSKRFFFFPLWNICFTLIWISTCVLLSSAASKSTVAEFGFFLVTLSHPVIVSPTPNWALLRLSFTGLISGRITAVVR